MSRSNVGSPVDERLALVTDAGLVAHGRGADGRFAVSVRFTWAGDPERGPELLAPVRVAATPALDGVGPLPFAALGAIHTDPPDPMPNLEEHTLLPGLPEEALQTLLALAGPTAECPQIVVEVRQLGGATGRGPEAAFVQRDAAFGIFCVGLAIPPLREAGSPGSARCGRDGLTDAARRRRRGRARRSGASQGYPPGRTRPLA